MSLILPILVIGIIVVLLGIVAAWKIRKQKKRHVPDYKAFFWMGLIWIIAGAAFMFTGRFYLNGLFAIGVIFFILGAANRDKWGKATPLIEKGSMTYMVLLIALAVLVLAGLAVFLLL